MSKWSMVRLGDVTRIQNGYAFKSSEFKKSGVPIVRIGNLNGNTVDIDSEICYTEKFWYDNPEFRIHKNDILIAMSGATVGKIGLYNQDIPALLNQRVGKISANSDKLDYRYLFRYMKSYIFNNQVKRMAAGCAQPNISVSQISEIRIPLPPLEIQKHIAQTLDTVSELLAMRKQQLAELDNLGKAVFYDMFGDPIKNDKGWETKKLSDCCYVNPKKLEIDYFTDDFEVSFVSMASVSVDGEISTNDIRKYKDVKAGFTYFYENDVLFAKITPCMENGKGAIARGLKNNIGFGSTEFHVLRPKEDISNSEWLYYLTILPAFRKIAEKNMKGSAGQKRVPASFFDKFLVPLPPFTLQKKFANIIRLVEEQKSIVKKTIEETQLLFDSLMSQYFDE